MDANAEAGPSRIPSSEAVKRGGSPTGEVGNQQYIHAQYGIVHDEDMSILATADREGVSERDEAEAMQLDSRDDARPEGEPASSPALEDNVHAARREALRLKFPRPFIPKKHLSKSDQSRATSVTAPAGPPQYAVKYRLQAHNKKVSSVKFSPDGQWLATAGADGRIRLFSVFPPSSKPSYIRTFVIPEPAKAKPIRASAPRYSNGNGPILGSGVNDITFSPDSRSLAVASDDKTVRIWRVDLPKKSMEDQDIEAAYHEKEDEANGATSTLNGLNGEGAQASSEELKILQGHTSYVFCVAYSPQGNLLASGSYDETVRIWDVKRARCLRTLPAHSDPVTAVGFSRDGTMLCTCGHDGLLRLWDASTGQCLKTLVDEANPPASFTCFTPNSRYILCSTLDSTIRLWDYHAAQCIKSYTGHKNTKYHIPALFWLPGDGDGRGSSNTYIVAGSEDGKIVFWDLQTRKIVFELEEHKEQVMCLALEPRSRMLVSASSDSNHTVNVWHLVEQPSTTTNGVATSSSPQVKQEDRAERRGSSQAGNANITEHDEEAML